MNWEFAQIQQVCAGLFWGNAPTALTYEQRIAHFEVPVLWNEYDVIVESDQKCVCTSMLFVVE